MTTRRARDTDADHGADPTPRGLRHVPALLRDHWLFALLLVAGAALRVVAALAYRPALLFADSLAYLAVHDAPLAPGINRPLGYTVAVLRPVLAIGDLATVAGVQHLIGLATAGVLYAALLRLGTRRWLAALATAPVLLDAYVVQIEHMVMPEALFHLALALALAVLTWTRPPSLRALALGGLLLAGAVGVRLVAQVLVVPLLAYAVLARPGLRAKTTGALVALVAFAAPLVVYALWFGQVHGDVRLSEQSDAMWYGRVAPFVDCERAEMPPVARQLCPTEPLGERPGPGLFVHSSSSPLADFEAPEGVDEGAVLRDFTRRAILAQPLDYARAVASDVLWVFRWDKVNKPSSPAPVERWHFTAGYPDLVDDPEGVVARYGHDGVHVDPDLAAFLRSYQLGGGFTRGPLLLAGVVLGLLGAVGVGRARRSGLRAVCLLWTAVPLSLLVVPAVLFEFSWRYQLPGVVLYPVAGVLGLTGLTSRATATSASTSDSASGTDSIGQ